MGSEPQLRQEVVWGAGQNGEPADLRGVDAGTLPALGSLECPSAEAIRG